MGTVTTSYGRARRWFKRWARKMGQSENLVVLQLYFSSLLGIIGRVVYDAYTPAQPLHLSGARILISAILIAAVFTWIYSRFKEAIKGLPLLMRFFVGFQLGFIADSVVNTLLTQQAPTPLV
jgi:hypothetical protein